jgi:uncharacterized protein
MYMKIHESYRKVVALCDKELIGKKFEEGKMQLDVRENFYKGNEMSEESLIEKLKDFKLDDSTFNIVGEKSVKAALTAGIISKGNIGKVGGIPFALSLL